MPGTTFLHIQNRDSIAARVMELPGLSVRIGRGVHCEVRLNDPGLAEVECVLRRRAGRWYVQPVGSSGMVVMGDHILEHSEILMPGVEFRVGETSLMLQAGSGIEVGSFRQPILVEPSDLGLEIISSDFNHGVRRDRPFPDARSAALDRPEGTSFEEERERLSQWRTSLERRERWLKARREERRWERRWRAAGESLRARSNASPRPASVTETERATAPSTEARPVASGALPLRGEPEAPIRATPAEDEEHPSLDIKLGSVTRLPPETDQGTSVANTWEAPRTLEVDEVEGEDDADLLGAPTIDEWGDSPFEFQEPEAPEPRRASPVTSRPETAPPPLPPTTEERPSDSPRMLVGPPSESPEGIPGFDREDWPSARTILEAHETRAVEPVRADSRSKPRRPEPTVARRPEHWAIPAWLMIPPMAATALLASVVGLVLSWTWSQDLRVEGTLADRLLQGERIPPRGIDTEPVPRPAWWGTTADHLYLQALALGRLEGDPDRQEQARFLLGLARNTSPSHAGVRFAMANLPVEGVESGLVRPVSELGLSRDVVAFAWTARRRLAAGETEAALVEYRQALEMITCADPRRAERSDAEGILPDRRHTMPYEDLIGPMVRDLSSREGWTFEEWSAALPPYGPVLLAAFRVLQEEGRSEAERALNQLLAAEEGPPRGGSVAVHLACRAEAMAVRDRWEEAERLYLDAIDAMPDADLRRTWWNNLSDIYASQNNLVKMRQARANARAARPPAPSESRSAIDRRDETSLGRGEVETLDRGRSAVP